MTQHPYTVFRHSPMAGNFVAECEHCKQVCAHWDADDVDPMGRLMHDCPAVNVWGTPIADVCPGFCPQCERPDPHHYDNCPLYVPPPQPCECGVYFCTTDHTINTDALRDVFAGEE